MSNTVSSYWASRSQREQILLGLMAGLLALVLGWYGLVQPLARAADAAEARRGLAAQRLAQTIAAEQAAPASAPAPSGDLGAFVAASAAQAGLTLASQSAAGPDEVAVNIEAADPSAVFGWLGALNSQGVGVANFTATGTGGGSARIEALLRRSAP